MFFRKMKIKGLCRRCGVRIRDSRIKGEFRAPLRCERCRIFRVVGSNR